MPDLIYSPFLPLEQQQYQMELERQQERHLDEESEKSLKVIPNNFERSSGGMHLNIDESTRLNADLPPANTNIED